MLRKEKVLILLKDVISVNLKTVKDYVRFVLQVNILLVSMNQLVNNVLITVFVQEVVVFMLKKNIGDLIFIMIKFKIVIILLQVVWVVIVLVISYVMKGKLVLFVKFVILRVDIGLKNGQILKNTNVVNVQM